MSFIVLLSYSLVISTIQAGAHHGWGPLRLGPVTAGAHHGWGPLRLGPITTGARYGWGPSRLGPITTGARYGWGPSRLGPITTGAHHGFFSTTRNCWKHQFGPCAKCVVISWSRNELERNEISLEFELSVNEMGFHIALRMPIPVLMKYIYQNFNVITSRKDKW